MGNVEIEFFADNNRVVCVPYSKGNMSKMSRDLKIPKSFFSETHYKIPPLKRKKVFLKVSVISTEEIDKIIKDNYKAEDFHKNISLSKFYRMKELEKEINKKLSFYEIEAKNYS